MRLQLKYYRVVKLELEMIPCNSESYDKDVPDFSMQIGNTFPDDNKREFWIGFRINVQRPNVKIFLEMDFCFDADEDISSEFMQGDFVKVNAPAIAFPYIRAFLSNLTMQSGYETVLLPSINFVSLKQ